MMTSIPHFGAKFETKANLYHVKPIKAGETYKPMPNKMPNYTMTAETDGFIVTTLYNQRTLGKHYPTIPSYLEPVETLGPSAYRDIAEREIENTLPAGEPLIEQAEKDNPFVVFKNAFPTSKRQPGDKDPIWEGITFKQLMKNYVPKDSDAFNLMVEAAGLTQPQ